MASRYVIVYFKRSSSLGTATSKAASASRLAHTGLVRHGAEEHQVCASTVDGDFAWAATRSGEASSFTVAEVFRDE